MGAVCHSRKAAILFLVVVVFSSGHSRAATIVVTPNSPIPYGSPATYSLQGLAGPASYTWEYKSNNGCGTWGAVSATNTDPTETVIETFPGSFTVRCKIIYDSQPGADGPFTPPPETPTLPVTVSVPDKVFYVSGDNVPVPPGTNSPIRFGVKSQGVECSYIRGYLQERIQNVTDVATGKTRLVDSGWTPPIYGTANPRMSIEGANRILDLKRYSNTAAGFAARAVGPITSAKQTFRLVFKDPCGNFTYCPLSPSFTLKSVKDADGMNYHYEHQESP